MIKKSGFDCEGQLIAMDLYGCSFESLNSQDFLLTEANKAARMAQMRVLAINIVPFYPQGLSLNLTLAESHLTIHTYPEFGYAAIDVFTCGTGNPMKAAEHFRKVLKPKVTSVNSQRRGVLPPSETGEESPFSPGERSCLQELTQF
jgi:S-adenosylmethionine decarboxylase